MYFEILMTERCAVVSAHHTAELFSLVVE